METIGVTRYCRTCAKSDVKEQAKLLNWVDLVQPTHCAAEMVQQIHTILANWNLQVSTNDGLPTSICDDCFGQFCNMLNFHQRCVEANGELQSKNKCSTTAKCSMLAQTFVTFECEYSNTEVNVALTSADLNFDDEIFIFDNLIEEDNERVENVECGDSVGHQQQQHQTHSETLDKVVAENHSTETVDRCVACEVCGKRYADRLNLRHHFEKYHSDTDFECTLCEKRFNSRRSLRYHSKWHDEGRQLKCSHCDRLFLNKRQLESHEQTHGGDGRKSMVGCAVCGKTFADAKTLRLHAYRQHAGEKPVKCGSCTAAFVSYLEKRLHSLEFHLINLTAIERIECISCHERYANSQDLIGHMRVAHVASGSKRPAHIINSKRVLQTRLARSKQGNGLLQCNECDMRFHMRSALERHRAVHSSEGRPHACQICNKRFKRAQDRNWHLKIHSTEKPHVCDVCGKGFSLSYVLTQHRRSHDALEKKFTCNACGRSYFSEKSLRSHERIHTGQSFYKCDLCNLEFVTHIRLKYHMQKQHTNTNGNLA